MYFIGLNVTKRLIRHWYRYCIKPNRNNAAQKLNTCKPFFYIICRQLYALRTHFKFSDICCICYTLKKWDKNSVLVRLVVSQGEFQLCVWIVWYHEYNLRVGIPIKILFDKFHFVFVIHKITWFSFSLSYRF